MNAPSLRSSHPFLRFFKEPFLKVSFAMALLGLILIIPQTAFAAIYTVKNTSDSGSGSLRDAINQVNAGSGGDTINFSGVTGTITVASTLVITKPVTINGPGANILAISGGDAVGVFSFGTGTTNSVISGLEITHGYATTAASHQGAGIYTAAAIFINNCTFSYNTAGGVGGLNAGGALFGSTPLVTINNSTFFQQHGSCGGRRGHLRHPVGGEQQHLLQQYCWTTGGSDLGANRHKADDQQLHDHRKLYDRYSQREHRRRGSLGYRESGCHQEQHRLWK